MANYRIVRLRLIEETFRVDADSEEDACHRLDEGDASSAIETAAVSTHYSNINSVEEI